MKYIQTIILLFLSYFGVFFLFDIQLANSSFSTYENQIFEWSNEKKVKKLQEVFKWLWLYEWVVDWNFDNIKYILLDYQLKSWIISNYNDYGAWYFWDKTMDALESQYWSEFLRLKEQYLKIDIPSKDERYFYVTAYYSPLPGQSRYTTWSYYWDIRLNWEWKVTASWKWVFNWLMAAPRNYAYWTKIYLEGIWVWSVEDRWWAIVNAWERWHDYDRIDIWMWYWDEWLQRALEWWTRKVKWYIVDDNASVSIEFDNSPIEKYEWLQATPNDRDVNNIVELQKLLRDIGLYNWEIDWRYERVKNILIKYQIENWIIDSKYDSAAGYFWPKTFAAMRQDYWSDTWIFKEKYYDWWDDEIEKTSLSYNQEKKLLDLKKQLENILNKRYSWDVVKINWFKNKLKKSIDDIIDKWISRETKIELIYFKNIL